MTRHLTGLIIDKYGIYNIILTSCLRGSKGFPMLAVNSHRYTLSLAIGHNRTIFWPCDFWRSPNRCVLLFVENVS